MPRERAPLKSSFVASFSERRTKSSPSTKNVAHAVKNRTPMMMSRLVIFK